MNISKQYKVVITNDCIKEIDDINKYISANLNSSNAAKLLMRKIKNL